MKTKILFIRMFVLSCILFILGFTVGSCSDDDDAVLQAGYGYAQFKLYKSGLAETKKRVPVPVSYTHLTLPTKA